MKHYRSKLLGFFLALIVALPLHAQEEESGGSDDSDDTGASPPSPVEGLPYYFSPMFSYLLADKDRGSTDGYGATLTLGKKMTYGLHLELSGFFAQASSDVSTGTRDNGTLKLSALSLTALVFPLSQYPNFYGIVGVGRGRGENLAGNFPNYSGTVFDTGIGYLHPLTARIALRLEARYHLDQGNQDRSGVQNPPHDNSEFYDGLFNAGVLIPLGAAARALPPPVEEPAPALVTTDAADSDGDGVPDDADKCPGTPAGAVVDASGCEADADGDGVVDRLDLCADTPSGTVVGANGCADDADGDGVLDAVDECPNTPAGAKVLGNGCALTGDCRTPRPGEQVDENGCAVNKAFILKGVVFEFDSTRLTEDAKKILDQVAETLKSYADVNVEIAGHTDSIGTDSYNLGLSERRSIAVKDYLTGKGVDAARMTPNGYGETQPIETNDTAEGQSVNRRVELRVIEKDGAALATPDTSSSSMEPATAVEAAPEAAPEPAADAAAEPAQDSMEPPATEPAADPAAESAPTEIPAEQAAPSDAAPAEPASAEPAPADAAPADTPADGDAAPAATAPAEAAAPG